MNTLFNPIVYAQQLEAAGVPTEQARAYAQVLDEVASKFALLGNRSHSGNGRGLETDLLSAVMSSEARLRRQISEAENRLRSQISETGTMLSKAIYDAARLRGAG
jgi:hypothetical protein